MIVVFYLVTYASVAVFLAACAWRVWRYWRLPFNLRWELYPVPHEESARVAHGGSTLEQSDWWTKPRRSNLVGELKFMLPEMLFLEALWKANRPLWYRSFPFHFGLYLLAGSCSLLLLTAVASLLWPALLVGGLGAVLRLIYAACGVGGLLLALGGSLALLHRRLTDDDLWPFNTSGDLFNLLFFAVSLALLCLGYLLRTPGQGGTLALVRGLLIFDTHATIAPLQAAGLLLGALLVAYIPLTHMSHFIAKYFTYHHIRWGDTPNLRGGPLEKRIARNLAYCPTWSAPHVAGDGKKTWVDIALANPTREERVKP
jgi:nitrate reductase gamma subunit